MMSCAAAVGSAPLIGVRVIVPFPKDGPALAQYS